MVSWHCSHESKVHCTIIQILRFITLARVLAFASCWPKAHPIKWYWIPQICTTHQKSWLWQTCSTSLVTPKQCPSLHWPWNKSLPFFMVQRWCVSQPKGAKSAGAKNGSFAMDVLMKNQTGGDYLSRLSHLQRMDHHCMMIPISVSSLALLCHSVTSGDHKWRMSDNANIACPSQHVMPWFGRPWHAFWFHGKQ